MREATSISTPLAERSPLTLERFDLDNHPDGLLLRLCGSLARLRGHVEALERSIAAIPAVTAEGRVSKELAL